MPWDIWALIGVMVLIGSLGIWRLIQPAESRPALPLLGHIDQGPPPAPTPKPAPTPRPTPTSTPTLED